ncbi:hypothetical protein [Ferruginibacter sp. SUN106]|uniref:hypothetical protein n=1 Tax=Ferruginibacter sp. SUN106 TaxID=2978348 RepID=UPI003D3604BD
MKLHPTIAFVFLLLLFSCNHQQKKLLPVPVVTTKKIATNDSSDIKNPLEEILKTIPKDIKPVFGYRFIISGDFDGDGKKEQLIEHFFSGVDNKETNKFYEGLSDYDQLVALTVKKDPVSFVLSDNKNIDTLGISSTSQLLGLSFLKNEGDLNGDGTDEVSYVVNWASWSSVNT